MVLKKPLGDARLRVGALTCVCFVLGPMGYFIWFYNAVTLVDAATVDLYTLVYAYFAQMVGIGAYMAVRRYGGPRFAEIAASVSLVLFVMTLEPAALSHTRLVVLVFGLVMNLVCGFFQGHYLVSLAEFVGSKWRGATFGCGYAAATLVSFLLSSADGGSLIVGLRGLIVCVLLTLVAEGCLFGVARIERPPDPAPALDTASLRSLVLSAAMAILMASLVKDVGYRSFATDFAEGGSIELSRLFYGVGLVIAGFTADLDRRWALACCVASLVIPFLQFALLGAGVSAFVLWSLGYVLQSFFTVWRVVLFADLAEDAGRYWLAGAGLAIGRVGDALGSQLSQALVANPAALVSVAGALFALASLFLFRLYRLCYEASVEEDERVQATVDPIISFCDDHALSRREQDVLRLLLEGMSNVQISHELVVTEATVKFHVRNILKKTGCANRNEVAKLYNRSLRGE